MNIKPLIISCTAVFFAFLGQGQVVFAQKQVQQNGSVVVGPTVQQTTSNSVTTDIGSAVSQQGFFKDNIGTFITQIINAGLILGAILCLFYLIIGAIEWITSEGDQNKNESARKRITAAVIGLGVMACVYALWILVLYFFGINKIPQLNLGGSSSSSSQTYSSGITSGSTSNTIPTTVCDPSYGCSSWSVNTTTGECNGGSCDAALNLFGSGTGHTQQSGDMYVDVDSLYNYYNWK